MRWTCPKCGKKLDISNEQLIANDGVIVCPQCLLQARQPIPKKRSTSTAASEESSTPPPPRKSGSNASTPPPHYTRMKQASTSYRYTGPGGSSSNTPATKKKSTKKKSKKKKQAGMSAWGCFGKSIVFTLILFAAYVFFGLLLESIQ